MPDTTKCCERRKRGHQGAYEPNLPPCEESVPLSDTDAEDPESHQQAFGHMELPQVARYTDNQRYVEHYDGADPTPTLDVPSARTVGSG